jgi:putative ABC transport system substrate-binding protein
MTGKILIWLLATIFLATASFAHAQQPTKVSRIGLLHAGTPESPSRRIEALRQDLRELGYVEGKHIIIEYRFAEGKADRLPDLAAELVRLKVEVIVTSGGPASQAAKKATTMIPIVMAGVGDPVRLGLVESLARPGGNITGITDLGPELIGKRLEVLKEAVPRVSRVAFLLNAAAGSRQIMLTEAEAAAQNLGVKLQAIEVQGPNPDFDDAFRAAANERVGAVITSPDPFIASHRKQVLELLAKRRLPTMHPTAAWTEAGGLMSYGTDFPDLYRRAATYVDKILKGTKPADLPVQRPTKFEFIINLKTAKQIGLTIPSNVLARADRVIR